SMTILAFVRVKATYGFHLPTQCSFPKSSHIKYGRGHYSCLIGRLKSTSRTAEPPLSPRGISWAEEWPLVVVRSSYHLTREILDESTAFNTPSLLAGDTKLFCAEDCLRGPGAI